MRTTAAALWDVLAKAANLAQMSGLHAVMLVAVCAALLRIPQSNRECAELQRCTRRLHALLQWPTSGCGPVALLWLESDIGGPVSKALGDAAGLVDFYKKSSLWCRVRMGRSMVTQLRDMQDVANSYCALVLFINAHLLVLQATARPTSDTTTIHETNDPSQSPGVRALTNCPTGTGACGTHRADDIGQGGVGSQTGNTDTADECEKGVPHIVISHA